MPEYDKFNLRFPDGMRDRLEESAKSAGRSLHAEIIERLRASLDAPTIEDRVAALEAQVARLVPKTARQPAGDGINWAALNETPAARRRKAGASK